MRISCRGFSSEIIEKTMIEINQKLYDAGLIPVVAIEDVETAVPLAGALHEGGLPVIEVTFRTECAAEAIQRIREAYPDMLIAAGTVLSGTQAKEAVRAGADLLISPGFNEAVVVFAKENTIPVLPGCSTPSDIERALSFDIDTVKFFPAEQSGGVEMLKALSAPYRNVKFVPTGGIGMHNFLNYLNEKSVIACGGSFFASKQELASGDYQKITARTAEAVKLLHGFQISSINVKGGEYFKSLNLFGFSLNCGNGNLDEEYSKIVVSVHFLNRAVSFLKRNGYEVRLTDKNKAQIINSCGFNIELEEKRSPEDKHA